MAFIGGCLKWMKIEQFPSTILGFGVSCGESNYLITSESGGINAQGNQQINSKTLIYLW
jgi:hypothetical protein